MISENFLLSGGPDKNSTWRVEKNMLKYGGLGD